jgi:uncharacterized protein YdeI (YjbR/CyaY-like superfamily)
MKKQITSHKCIPLKKEGVGVMMKANVPELLFPLRDDFRTWLNKNAEKSDGVWLIFSKDKKLVTLSANEALEEALCFGWIDGQMKSIDNTKYKKYFTRRRFKSHWSEKNKKTAEILIKKGLMTELGKKAVEEAKRNGSWNDLKHDMITSEQVNTFIEKLIGTSPAYENFLNMSASVKLTYTKRYYSFKSIEAQKRDFEKIVDRLNKNLKPM